MWRRKRKIEEKKEKKEKSLLKELCGDDAKLYDVLGGMLYLDPIAAISRKNLEILIEEAEKSIKDENYEEARQKYRRVVDKAIFEATQNPRERSRYIKVIQDIASKTENYKFMSERIEDVIKIASLYYNERLEELGVRERRETRRQERKDVEREEQMEEKKAGERRETRRQERKEMGRGERKEAEREDKREEKKAGERRETRRQERKEAETEEKRMEEREEERRKERRKELRKTR
ncbi:MAG: hypothetical protein ACXACF_09865 [Candidatus Hermodarchaeia archaeon]|jgi:hypothetical protein